MNYLKLVNCPVRGLFPETGNKINWVGAGFDPVQVRRYSTQGTDDNGDYVSLFPISDETKLTESGIVDTVNNNADPDDTAEVVTQTVYDSLKTLIDSLRV